MGQRGHGAPCQEAASTARGRRSAVPFGPARRAGAPGALMPRIAARQRPEVH